MAKKRRCHVEETKTRTTPSPHAYTQQERFIPCKTTGN